MAEFNLKNGVNQNCHDSSARGRANLYQQPDVPKHSRLNRTDLQLFSREAIGKIWYVSSRSQLDDVVF
jgi:hypothetical protein